MINNESTINLSINISTGQLCTTICEGHYIYHTLNRMYLEILFCHFNFLRKATFLYHFFVVVVCM